jgi:hypothetical protein
LVTQQFLEIIARTRPLQPLIFQCKTFEDIFAEPLRGPNPELRAAMGLNPVTDGDDDIEVIALDLVGLTVGGSCCIICNNWFPAQFALIEDVADVPGDYRFIPLEQLRHLIEGQPDGFAEELHFQPCLAILRLVEDHFLLVRRGFIHINLLALAAHS